MQTWLSISPTLFWCSVQMRHYTAFGVMPFRFTSPTLPVHKTRRTVLYASKISVNLLAQKMLIKCWWKIPPVVNIQSTKTQQTISNLHAYLTVVKIIRSRQIYFSIEIICTFQSFVLSLVINCCANTICEKQFLQGFIFSHFLLLYTPILFHLRPSLAQKTDIF